jgi:hypothetical protein
MSELSTTPTEQVAPQRWGAGTLLWALIPLLLLGALLGIYVGFIPVGLGLLWYPFWSSVAW